MKLIRVKEGEFKRLIKTRTVTTLLAQESNVKDGKFSLFGIDENNQQGYAIRHGRVDVLRTWRIDVLSAFAKSLGFTSIEVYFSRIDKK
ncbi:hypothetical protein [Aliivibrio fischeri]|uniref:hypothetical protein n=1 Tax=Aliivibrio fischeri TaxID=668 RepID=UPI00080E708E|nr:hypothetical protein [Aliivibrio fischeri]OCH42331.1 hypothetical protein A6E02_14190 [Aliivibrio fischeri]